MVRLYSEGSSMAQIAADVGLSRQRVQQLVSPHIEPRTTDRRMALRTTRLREAYERVAAGESTRDQEAERLGYKHEASLRDAFCSIGLKTPRVAQAGHGTLYCYSRFKCRCEECRQAAKDEHAKRVKRGPKKHGLASSYQNYGCRCTRCRRANRLYRRQRKATQRKKQVTQNGGA